MGFGAAMWDQRVGPVEPALSGLVLPGEIFLRGSTSTTGRYHRNQQNFPQYHRFHPVTRKRDDSPPGMKTSLSRN
jgi:hypothetical protein